MNRDPGNRERFEELLTDQAYQAAWRHAYRLATGTSGGTREDAEDLLQEALAQAYRSLPQLRDPSRFTAWLVSIVRTRFLDWRRRCLASGVNLELDAERCAEEATAIADPLGELVQEALLLLPAAQREIISLFYLDGLSLIETGQVLRIAPRAIRQRLHRARQALRRQLKLLDASLCGTVCPASSEGITS